VLSGPLESETGQDTFMAELLFQMPLCCFPL